MSGTLLSKPQSFNMNQQFANDVSLKKKYSYQFYEDYFILNHPSGVSRVQWADLVKFVQLRTAVLLYVSTRLAHIIPKRVFAGNEAGLEKLRQLIKSNQKSKRLKFFKTPGSQNLT